MTEADVQTPLEVYQELIGACLGCFALLWRCQTGSHCGPCGVVLPSSRVRPLLGGALVAILMLSTSPPSCTRRLRRGLPATTLLLTACPSSYFLFCPQPRAADGYDVDASSRHSFLLFFNCDPLNYSCAPAADGYGVDYLPPLFFLLLPLI